MRVSVCADEPLGIAQVLVAELQRRGHQTIARSDRANVAHLGEMESTQPRR